MMRTRVLVSCFCAFTLACSAGDDGDATSLGSTFESGGVGSDGLTTSGGTDDADTSDTSATTEFTTTGDPTTTTGDPTTTTGDPTTTTGDPTTTTTGGDPGDGGCDMPASDMIDDFEDGDGALIAAGGRQGYWYTFNDASGGTQTPPSSAVVPEMGGACMTGMAMHTSGSGFSVWGAGLGIDLNNTGGAMGVKMPYDVSSYTGIVLAARGSGSIRANVQIAATIETTEGGTCAMDCDPHGMMLNLTNEWQQFTLPFAQLTQEGWGTAAAWDPTSVMSIQFKVGPNQTLDLWVDEIGFY